MTYLNPIRIHFSGQFQADPSTVNNDVRHFDTSAFNPAWQEVGTANALNGWWNPDGSGSFRFVGCTVQSVSYGDGSTSTTDPIVGMQIMGANARVAGKIVDLDPQQQMVSQLWGLIVRLTNGTSDLLSGPFEPAPFTDLWFRAQGSGSDMGMSSFWQSVIGPVTWGDLGNSQALQELQAASSGGLLSIKFNVDGYNNNYGSPGFTLGRCVGTIGPASPNEPSHFVLGRQLFPTFSFNANAGGAVSNGPMYCMQAVISGTSLIADFGNALPTETPGSDLANIGTVEIGWLDANDSFTSVGTLGNYTSAGWYEQAAGIQTFANLSSDQLSSLATNRIAVAVDGAPVLMECAGGVHVRADNFVYRLNPGDPANVMLWATQYGQPLASTTISIAADTSQLQGGAPTNDPLVNNIPAPPVADPADAISFPDTVTTGSNGVASLTIKSSDPGNKRDYIDGQVYGVRPLPQSIANTIGNPPAVLTSSTPNPVLGVNPADFISLLVWSQYEQPANPQWSDVAPILAQYAVLYPVMDQLIDLTNENEVNQQAALLQLAFGLPMSDPNSMPVTRDLSDAKRATILQYLAAQQSWTPTDIGVAPHGKPTTLAASKVAATEAAPPPTADSKTLALQNRNSAK